MSLNNDLIRRSDLKAAVDDICYSWGEETEVEGYVLIALVDKLPAVDAEPVRHGYWIPQGNTRTKFMCSDCKGRNHDGSGKYCSQCGSKMDGDANAAD